MLSSQNNKGKIDPTVHDFESEKPKFMILGGFVLVKKPIFLYILNILWLVFLFTLHPFIFTTGLYTVLNYSLEKMYAVESLHNMSLCLAILSISVLANSTRSSRTAALKQFKTGVFLYARKTPKISQIKKRYVDLFRKIVPLLYAPILAFAFLKTFLSPILHLFSVKSEIGDENLNPYLPMKQYVPFNTRTPFGFGVAFFLHAMFFFSMEVAVTCHLETFVSCAMQFTAQLEILNYTLKTIEKRAQYILRKQETRMVKQSDYKPDYESCLLFCLKENILHHLAILRLSKDVKPYIEWTSSVGVVFFSILLAAAATLALKSSEVRDNLYTIPWPVCGKKFRVILNIMMANTKNPIVLHAKGFGNDISLENFAHMTSLAYRIVNVLR